MSEREPAPHEPTLPLSDAGSDPPPSPSPAGPHPPPTPPSAGPYPPPTAPAPASAYPPPGQAPYPPPGGGQPYLASGTGAALTDGPVIAQIGELAVTSSTVHTPAGPIPLHGSTWHVSDQWMTVQKIPTWAIVIAIVGFCVVGPFSLLVLLVKEAVYQGVVHITVSNGPQQYVSRIPVTNQGQVHYINQQVNYVRSLAAL